MTIDILTIECAGVAGVSARNDAAGQAFTKVTLENPDMLALMVDWLAKTNVSEVLELIPNHDIELYLKGENNE